MPSILETVGPRAGSAPFTYTLSEEGTVDVMAVFAEFNGAAASGDFLPTVTVRAQNGTILARVSTAESVAAGGSADVTFAPFLRADAAGGHVIEDEGTPLAQRADLNFVGAGVTAADSGGKTVVTIPSGGSSWGTTITKSADESRASTTSPLGDSELFFLPALGGAYQFEFVIAFTDGGAGPDIKFGVEEDANPRGSYLRLLTVTSTPVGLASLVQTNTFFIATASPGIRLMTLSGWFTSHTSGGAATFQFTWAQNVSNASPTIVKAGSLLRYTRII